MERLLLVEFAATDRFHRAVLFPYLVGFATDVGVSTRWLRFGVPAATRHLRGETGVGLDAADLARVTQVIDELEPTKVVLNMTPSEKVVEALRSAAVAAHVCLLGASQAASENGGEQLEDFGLSLASWARQLDVEPPDSDGETSFQIIRPSFAYEAGNAAARQMQPLPFVILGEECTFNKPLGQHPLYTDLDLSGCVRQGGCAFCARPPGGVSPVAFSLDRAREQLDAVVRTVPPYNGRLAVRLVGEPAIRHIEAVARLAREVGLERADLLFDARSDEIVRCHEAIRSAAGELGGSDLVLHIALVGIESFVRAELDRMNKGVTPLQNLDAIRILMELERDCRGTFRFREHGGLSLILFTPWTELEDLAANLRIIQICGLEQLSGKVFNGRLRLEQGLPMTALARRDDLILDTYEDETYDTAARNLYGEEIPWRFRDQRVDAICRTLLQMSERPNQAGDIDAAVAVVDETLAAGTAAVASPSKRSPDRQVAPPPQRELDASAASAAERFSAELLLALTREEIKPVSKLELASVAQGATLIKELGLPNAQTREPIDRDHAIEVFFGTRRADVQRLVDLTEQAANPRDSEQFVNATLEIGSLLGYPACCVEAFAIGQTSQERDNYGWMQLDRRMAVPGRVHPGLNPWPGVLSNQYVPCSLHCPATVQMLPTVHAIAESVAEDHDMRGLLERMKHPWLVILHGQGVGLELIPDEDPSESFRLTTGLSVGFAPELELATGADQIVLEPERLQLYRHGRLLFDLSARAFVWWHEKAFQADFWTRILALRAFKTSDGALGSARGRGETASRSPGGDVATHLEEPIAALARGLNKAMEQLVTQGLRFNGSADWELRPRNPESLTLTLGSGGSEAILHVTHARRRKPHLFRVGPFAFSFPQDSPLDTDERRGSVRELARHLSAWVRARKPK